MSRVRNLLVAFGAFWFSLWIVPWLAIAFGKLNSGIIYDSVWYEAIAMGMMTSMGRAVAASLAGAITAMVVDDKKPERWALIVAALYVVDAPVRYGRWHVSPTPWDHLSRAVDLIWPAIACLIGMMGRARHRQKRSIIPVSPPTT